MFTSTMTTFATWRASRRPPSQTPTNLPSSHPLLVAVCRTWIAPVVDEVRLWSFHHLEASRIRETRKNYARSHRRRHSTSQAFKRRDRTLLPPPHPARGRHGRPAEVEGREGPLRRHRRSRCSACHVSCS